jgi:glyceraldehyde 3-phosphate dehydrogenase
MGIRIAINGFGRIGRLTLRHLLARRNIEVVAINDLADPENLVNLFKHDSAQGTYPGRVKVLDSTMAVGRRRIPIFNQPDPENLPWKRLRVDLVLECTGIFRTRDEAGKHLAAGARRVAISAPAKGDDITTMVLGVNDDTLKLSDRIVSNASCTTNCLAPVVKVLDTHLGIVQGSMTTTHAYTGGQRLVDMPNKDLRRARAAAANIVPTSTGAATALEKVWPTVSGKISALALRVPVLTGSLVELNVLVEKSATAEQINRRFRAAARGPMKGILEYSEAPLVSSDIVGNTHSSIFDAGLTRVHGPMVKVVSWYDNEAGYSARMADLAAILGKMPLRRRSRSR